MLNSLFTKYIFNSEDDCGLLKNNSNDTDVLLHKDKMLTDNEVTNLENASVFKFYISIHFAKVKSIFLRKEHVKFVTYTLVDCLIIKGFA